MCWLFLDFFKEFDWTILSRLLKLSTNLAGYSKRIFPQSINGQRRKKVGKKKDFLIWSILCVTYEWGLPFFRGLDGLAGFLLIDSSLLLFSSGGLLGRRFDCRLRAAHKSGRLGAGWKFIRRHDSSIRADWMRLCLFHFFWCHVGC